MYGDDDAPWRWDSVPRDTTAGTVLLAVAWPLRPVPPPSPEGGGLRGRASGLREPGFTERKDTAGQMATPTALAGTRTPNRRTLCCMDPRWGVEKWIVGWRVYVTLPDFADSCVLSRVCALSSLADHRRSRELCARASSAPLRCPSASTRSCSSPGCRTSSSPCAPRLRPHEPSQRLAP